MTTCRMEISKEVYERSLAHNNRLTDEDVSKIFPVEILWGYGLYGTYTYEKDGVYWCKYSIGDSCD